MPVIAKGTEVLKSVGSYTHTDTHTHIHSLPGELKSLYLI